MARAFEGERTAAGSRSRPRPLDSPGAIRRCSQADAVLRLQRTAGNAAVVAMLQRARHRPVPATVQRNGTEAEDAARAHRLPNANCYGYACGYTGDKKLSPGQVAKANKVKGARAIAFDAGSSDRFRQQAVKDGLLYVGQDFQDALRQAQEAAGDGLYLVAGFRGTSGQTHGDHHWYRRHADGSWSHKPGLGPVMWMDMADKPIRDDSGGPETAVKWLPRLTALGGGKGYEELIGYFLCSEEAPLLRTYEAKEAAPAKGCGCVVQ